VAAGVEVVAVDPSAAFRKALRMWPPRTAVSVDALHLVKLANDALTEARQRLPRNSRAAADALLTRSGRTGACSCAAARHSPNADATGSADISARVNRVNRVNLVHRVAAQPGLELSAWD
jgi:hypothetical protein